MCLSRSGDVVEYLMKDQWFVSCRGMADKAIEVGAFLFVFHILTCNIMLNIVPIAGFLDIFDL